ncbi:hypothetical protein EVAR_47758_1 [Eumeta japonica]|uniref:Uncharacterized protein n=1 Tax=Eumeta variegata TaxID=151549 RepID=A0A4C1XY08_EUMVA|nr:hypothetical protein EVAR_47758_1 [Eumeta japonica]
MSHRTRERPAECLASLSHSTMIGLPRARELVHSLQMYCKLLRPRLEMYLIRSPTAAPESLNRRRHYSGGGNQSRNRSTPLDFRATSRLPGFPARLETTALLLAR